MKISIYEFIVCFIIFIKLVACQEIHQCVHATRKMSKAGDGSTEDSCMGCDPTLPSPAYYCQGLVDQLYRQCDGVCLPDGYYFDPQFTLTGCWSQVKPAVKIKVERCGCNSALSSLSKLSIGAIMCIIFATIYALV